jgi:predicted DNA-binding transcriptional regulator AlpA
MTLAEDHLWTVEETAHYLGLPVSTIYSNRSLGRPVPEGIRLGKHLRFSPHTVKEWVAQQAESQRERGRG